MTIRTQSTVYPPERPPLLEWQRLYKVGIRCDQTDPRWQEFNLDRRHGRLNTKRETTWHGTT